MTKNKLFAIIIFSLIGLWWFVVKRAAIFTAMFNQKLF